MISLFVLSVYYFALLLGFTVSLNLIPDYKIFIPISILILIIIIASVLFPSIILY